MIRHLARTLALVLLLGAGLAACGDDDGGTADDAPDSTSTAPGETGPAEDEGALEGTVLVFAAASLTDAFGEVAAAFEAANPGVRVELNFGGSSSLREQILDGAPADVFASANESNMATVVDAGAAGEPQTFVTNLLEIAVPAGNAAGVTGLEDFADPDLLIGLCAEEVPCGEFGREILASAGIEPSLDTNEPDVRSLLTKIEANELDAGIVYRTDILATGDAVEGIAIPEEHNVIATYPIATLTEAPNDTVAAAFVAFVLSDEGQTILESYGFSPA